MIKIFPIQQKTEKFSVRLFEINHKEAERDYDNFIRFQLVNDKCDIIESYAEGEEIAVTFSLSGRYFGDSHFQNLNAWKIEPANPGVLPQSESGIDPIQQLVEFPKTEEQLKNTKQIKRSPDLSLDEVDGETDDLPF